MQSQPSAADAFKNIELPTSVPKMVYLDASYTPGIHDVICQRGKTAFTHVENRRLRFLVKANRSKYFDSINNNKASRSAIVTSVIDTVRRNGGRFVRFDAQSQLWLEVSDRVSREKVGHALRDPKDTRSYQSKAAVGRESRFVQQHEKERIPIEEVAEDVGSSSQHGLLNMAAISDIPTTVHQCNTVDDFCNEPQATCTNLTSILEWQPLPFDAATAFDNDDIRFLSELCSDLGEDESESDVDENAPREYLSNAEPSTTEVNEFLSWAEVNIGSLGTDWFSTIPQRA